MSDRSASPEFRTPLHDLGLPERAKAARNDNGIGVWAAETTGRGFMNLRGDLLDTKFSEAIKVALGGALPAEPCAFRSTSDADVLWLSPDEWMIAGPRQHIKTLLANCQSSLHGVRGLATDNSSGYTEIHVSGQSAGAALAHCTLYNLHDLTPGRVVGTTFGKVQAFLRRDGDGVRLVVRRSFADYVWRFLERASQPYGFGVVDAEIRRGRRS